MTWAQINCRICAASGSAGGRCGRPRGRRQII